MKQNQEVKIMWKSPAVLLSICGRCRIVGKRTRTFDMNIGRTLVVVIFEGYFGDVFPELRRLRLVSECDTFVGNEVRRRW